MKKLMPKLHTSQVTYFLYCTIMNRLCNWPPHMILCPWVLACKKKLIVALSYELLPNNNLLASFLCMSYIVIPQLNNLGMNAQSWLVWLFDFPSGICIVIINYVHVIRGLQDNRKKNMVDDASRRISNVD